MRARSRAWALLLAPALLLAGCGGGEEQVEFQLVQLDEGHTLAEFYPSIESEGPIPTWR